MSILRVRKNRNKHYKKQSLPARIAAGALAVCLSVSGTGFISNAQVSDNISTENGTDTIFDYIHEFEGIKDDLDTYKENFTQDVEEMRGKMSDHLKDMTKKYDKEFEEVSKDLDAQFSDTNERLNEKYNEISKAVNEQIDEIRDEQNRKAAEQDARLEAIQHENEVLEEEMDQFEKWKASSDTYDPIPNKTLYTQAKAPSISTTPFEATLTWNYKNYYGQTMDPKYVKGFKVYRIKGTSWPDNTSTKEPVDITDKSSYAVSCPNLGGKYIPYTSASSGSNVNNYTYSLFDDGDDNYYNSSASSLSYNSTYSYWVVSVLANNEDDKIDSENEGAKATRISVSTKALSTMTPGSSTATSDKNTFKVSWTGGSYSQYVNGYNVYVFSDSSRSKKVYSKFVSGVSSRSTTFVEFEPETTYYTAVWPNVKSGYSYYGDTKGASSAGGGAQSSNKTPLNSHYTPGWVSGTVYYNKVDISWGLPEYSDCISSYKVQLYSGSSVAASRTVSGGTTSSVSFSSCSPRLPVGGTCNIVVTPIATSNKTVRKGELPKAVVKGSCSTPTAAELTPTGLNVSDSGSATWTPASKSEFIESYTISGTAATKVQNEDGTEGDFGPSETVTKTVSGGSSSSVSVSTGKTGTTKYSGFTIKSKSGAGTILEAKEFNGGTAPEVVSKGPGTIQPRITSAVSSNGTSIDVSFQSGADTGSYASSYILHCYSNSNYTGDAVSPVTVYSLNGSTTINGVTAGNTYYLQLNAYLNGNGGKPAGEMTANGGQNRKMVATTLPVTDYSIKFRSDHAKVLYMFDTSRQTNNTGVSCVGVVGWEVTYYDENNVLQSKKIDKIQSGRYYARSNSTYFTEAEITAFANGWNGFESSISVPAKANTQIKIYPWVSPCTGGYSATEAMNYTGMKIWVFINGMDRYYNEWGPQGAGKIGCTDMGNKNHSVVQSYLAISHTDSEKGWPGGWTSENELDDGSIAYLSNAEQVSPYEAPGYDYRGEEVYDAQYCKLESIGDYWWLTHQSGNYEYYMRSDLKPIKDCDTVIAEPGKSKIEITYKPQVGNKVIFPKDFGNNAYSSGFNKGEIVRGTGYYTTDTEITKPESSTFNDKHYYHYLIIFDHNMSVE